MATSKRNTYLFVAWVAVLCTGIILLVAGVQIRNNSNGDSQMIVPINNTINNVKFIAEETHLNPGTEIIYNYQNNISVCWEYGKCILLGINDTFTDINNHTVQYNVSNMVTCSDFASDMNERSLLCTIPDVEIDYCNECYNPSPNCNNIKTCSQCNYDCQQFIIDCGKCWQGDYGPNNPCQQICDYETCDCNFDHRIVTENAQVCEIYNDTICGTDMYHFVFSVGRVPFPNETFSENQNNTEFMYVANNTLIFVKDIYVRCLFSDEECINTSLDQALAQLHNDTFKYNVNSSTSVTGLSDFSSSSTGNSNNMVSSSTGSSTGMNYITVTFKNSKHATYSGLIVSGSILIALSVAFAFFMLFRYYIKKRNYTRNSNRVQSNTNNVQYNVVEINLT